MLLNGQVTIKTYVIEPSKVLVVVEDGADTSRVKEFLLQQDEVIDLEIDQKKIEKPKPKTAKGNEKARIEKGKKKSESEKKSASKEDSKMDSKKEKEGAKKDKKAGEPKGKVEKGRKPRTEL